ncbi:MAG: DUF1772 domain-containing protein [Steroidobacteraceae bacterium]
MLTAATFIAVLATTVFAGAALYINLVEHPARMSCSTELAATVWAPSYQRATMMQAPLAVIGGLAGLFVWWLDRSWLWLIAATLIIAVVPFTLIVIMKTNQQLLAPDRDLASLQTRALLTQWARLHAVRTVMSLVASGLMIWKLAVG